MIFGKGQSRVHLPVITISLLLLVYLITSDAQISSLLCSAPVPLSELEMETFLQLDQILSMMQSRARQVIVEVKTIPTMIPAASLFGSTFFWVSDEEHSHSGSPEKFLGSRPWRWFPDRFSIWRLVSFPREVGTYPDS